MGGDSPGSSGVFSAVCCLLHKGSNESGSLREEADDQHGWRFLGQSLSSERGRIGPGVLRFPEIFLGWESVEMFSSGFHHQSLVPSAWVLMQPGSSVLCTEASGEGKSPPETLQGG